MLTCPVSFSWITCFGGSWLPCLNDISSQWPCEWLSWKQILSPGQGFRWHQCWPPPWLQPRERCQAQTTQVSCSQIPDPEKLDSKCFEPLSFGILCYRADNCYTTSLTLASYLILWSLHFLISKGYDSYLTGVLWQLNYIQFSNFWFQNPFTLIKLRTLENICSLYKIYMSFYIPVVKSPHVGEELLSVSWRGRGKEISIHKFYIIFACTESLRSFQDWMVSPGFLIEVFKNILLIISFKSDSLFHINKTFFKQKLTFWK